MKRYFEHMKSKSTHERRARAMQISAAILVVVFLMWVATLGWRFAATPPQTANSGDAGQTASAANGVSNNGQATLIVVPSPGSP